MWIRPPTLYDNAYDGVNLAPHPSQYVSAFNTTSPYLLRISSRNSVRERAVPQTKLGITAS